MSDLFFYLLPFIVGGAISGIVCGLLPFVLATKRRRPLLGFTALAVCVACGICLGAILAFPIATSFAAAILLTQPREPKPRREKVPAAFPDVREAETLT
ncbi:MAG: hypothetical protein AAFO84_08415 [Cyanobacteria bacterium J06598_1]